MQTATDHSFPDPGIPLDHPNPMIALAMHISDSGCPYLEAIYHAIKRKMDELQVTA